MTMGDLAITALAESTTGIFTVLGLSILGLFLNLGLFIKTVLDRFTRQAGTVRCTVYITHMLVSVAGCLVVYLSLAHSPGARWMCLLADVLGGLGYQASVGCLLLAAVLGCVRRNINTLKRRPHHEHTLNQVLIRTPPSSRSLTVELVALSSVWLLSALAVALHVVPAFRNPLANQTRTCQSLSLMSEHGQGWLYPFVLYVCVDGGMLTLALVMSVVARCRARGLALELLVIILACWTLWTPTAYFGYLGFSAVPAWIDEYGPWLELGILLSPAVFAPLCSLIAICRSGCRRKLDPPQGGGGGGVTGHGELRNTRVESVYRRMDQQKVSLRLSEYLDCGQCLSPQDAIVMTSTLSQAISSLHKLGMSPGAVDADNVMLDCDAEGNIIKSHLMGMPVQPPHLNDQIVKDNEAIGKLFNHVMHNSKLQAPRDTSRTTSMKVVPTRRSTKIRDAAAPRGQSLHSNMRKSYHKPMYLNREASLKHAGFPLPMRTISRRSESELLSIRVSRLSVRTQMRGSQHGAAEEAKPEKKRRTTKKAPSTTTKSKWFDNPAFQDTVEEGPDSPFSPHSDSTYVSEITSAGIEPKPISTDVSMQPSTEEARNPALAKIRRHLHQQSLEEEDEEYADDKKLIGKNSKRKKRIRGVLNAAAAVSAPTTPQPQRTDPSTTPTTPQPRQHSMDRFTKRPSLQKRRSSSRKLSLNIPDHMKYCR